jgi:hypothetical protein
MPPILLELSVDSAIAAAALSLVVPPPRYALLVARFGIWDGGFIHRSVAQPASSGSGHLGRRFPVFVGRTAAQSANNQSHTALWFSPLSAPPLMAIGNLVCSESHWVSDGLASSAMAVLGFLIGFYPLRPFTVAWPRPRVVALPILIAVFSLAT